MIVHVFNSSIVSGPETLVLPALRYLDSKILVVFLYEERLGDLPLGPINYARSLALPVAVVPVLSRFDRKAVKMLSALFEKHTPKIVHAHDVKASAYSLKASDSNRSYQLISTHHGVRGRVGFRSKLYEKYYCRMILPKFDQVFSVCTSDRDILIHRGLNPALVRAHLNGVDRPLIGNRERKAMSKEFRSSWKLSERGIPEDSFIFGFLGRLAPEKRIDKILRSLAFLKKQLPEKKRWDLLIFGRGSLHSELSQLTADLGLTENVHFMGYRKSVGSELAGIDCLLSFSMAEGLPINLLEAGWAATPVFSTAVDGVLDLIPDSEFGILFEPGIPDQIVAEKLSQLLTEPEKLKQSGRSLQKRVQSEFSGKRWLSDLQNYYQGVRV